MLQCLNGRRVGFRQPLADVSPRFSLLCLPTLTTQHLRIFLIYVVVFPLFSVTSFHAKLMTSIAKMC